MLQVSYGLWSVSPYLDSSLALSMERVQRQRWRDGWQMVTASREIRRYWRQIRVCPDMQDQIHANEYVEQEMAVEQPVSYKEARC